MQLTTPRLILRDFVREDWRAVLVYQDDPRYLRYYEWEARDAATVRKFIEEFINQQAEQPRRRYQLAVVRRDDGRLIGNVGIRLDTAESYEAELGYEIAPDEWGQGFATEAAAALVAFGFGSLGLHRINAWCVADNAASARVLQKLGMSLEGRVREREYYKGRWWDVLLYGLLAKEWARSGVGR